MPPDGVYIQNYCRVLAMTCLLGLGCTQTPQPVTVPVYTLPPQSIPDSVTSSPGESNPIRAVGYPRPKNEVTESVEELLDECRRSAVGSPEWSSLVFDLQYFDDPQIRHYLREVIPSAPPFARAVGYKLCLIKKWDDLKEQAEKDLNDPTFVGSPNADDEACLCGISEKYLYHLKYPNAPPRPTARPLTEGITLTPSVNIVRPAQR